ncbi:MAG: glycosyltransferase [Acidobacteria bacterium]|nr:glycosyltransferase [Acidobacteriota bacterium]MCA1643049.1 glycosyltransferase [Acidobacteriota bacterium]
MESKRIVLATFGSFGDVHPYIALALELKSRGHSVVIATSEIYREKMDSVGVELSPLRPDDLPTYDEPDRFSEFIEKFMDPRMGMAEILKQVIIPYLRVTYDDLTAAARGADLILTHPLTFLGRLVAEKQGVAWASSVLAPSLLFSKYDPLVPPQLPAMHGLFKLHPLFFQAAMALGRWQMRGLVRAVGAVRAEVGLPPSRANPLLEGQHSPALVLALFSKVLAEPQRDYPPNTRTTGFPFYDRRDYFGETEAPRALLDFLDRGEPPVVFALGSTAVWIAKDFYVESIKAARALGRRALLLIGHERNRPAGGLPEGVAAFEYAPFGEVLPRAAVVVHHGGVGSTGQALRAGRPQLVVPFSHDQFDNGARVARRGAARMLPRPKYNATTAARELRRLLDDPSYAARAAEAGRIVQGEDGARTACDLIEEKMFGATTKQDETSR